MKTVVFIHGAFMSAESWGPWMQRFEARGYKAVSPAWPFLDHSVDELQRTPDRRFGKLGIGEIVDNYAAIIREIGAPPVLVGHSFGATAVALNALAIPGRASTVSVAEAGVAVPAFVVVTLPVELL